MIQNRMTSNLGARKTFVTNHTTNTYPACMQRNIEKIKRILKTDPTPQIYIGNNWVRINGQSFNGITREMFNEIIKEISCNIAINNV